MLTWFLAAAFVAAALVAARFAGAWRAASDDAKAWRSCVESADRRCDVARSVCNRLAVELDETKVELANLAASHEQLRLQLDETERRADAEAAALRRKVADALSAHERTRRQIAGAVRLLANEVPV